MSPRKVKEMENKWIFELGLLIESQNKFILKNDYQINIFLALIFILFVFNEENQIYKYKEHMYFDFQFIDSWKLMIFIL